MPRPLLACAAAGALAAAACSGGGGLAGRAQSDATRIAAQEAAVVAASRRLLISLAGAPQVFDSRCPAFLAERARGLTQYTALVALDARGDLACISLPSSTPVNAADRSYFKRAVGSRQFSVGEYQTGRVSGKASVAFAYPVFDSHGRVRRVLVAPLDLAWANAHLAVAGVPKGAEVLVVDRLGTIVVRWPSPAGRIGQLLGPSALGRALLGRGTGTVEAAGADGVMREYGMTPVAGSAGNLRVAVGLRLSTSR